MIPALFLYLMALSTSPRLEVMASGYHATVTRHDNRYQRVIKCDTFEYDELDEAFISSVPENGYWVTYNGRKLAEVTKDSRGMYHVTVTGSPAVGFMNYRDANQCVAQLFSEMERRELIF